MLSGIRRPDPAVSLIGDIDVGNAAIHGDLLCSLLGLAHAATLHVDCSELEFLELRGMAMMVRVDRYGATLGTEVWWTGLRPRHRKLLELAGLDAQLRLCAPEDEHPATGTDGEPVPPTEDLPDRGRVERCHETRNRRPPAGRYTRRRR